MQNNQKLALVVDVIGCVIRTLLLLLVESSQYKSSVMVFVVTPHMMLENGLDCMGYTFRNNRIKVET